MNRRRLLAAAVVAPVAVKLPPVRVPRVYKMLCGPPPADHRPPPGMALFVTAVDHERLTITFDWRPV